eukprot:NODE_6536_length_504_cov_3.200000_g5755_i0.p3 GENE.NODE_6536_length_504_cov_3.200000_g5755_i0~~NODE_6536_length_504_cov_3.200000_g5755_i0.p3  ORF type:complete len:55 (+),score=10.35 NODE_6536_length_504_cov_3.200000_g5755_i0:321-485(+)
MGPCCPVNGERERKIFVTCGCYRSCCAACNPEHQHGKCKVCSQACIGYINYFEL